MAFPEEHSSWYGDSTYRQVLAGLIAGVGTLYILGKVFREALHRLLPNYVPGQPNTALLATPWPKISGSVSAEDLKNAKAYDYIIVGTGTAGCVLANRLSADSANTVLAVESGHSDLKQICSRIPAAYGFLWTTAVAWQYFTEKEPECNKRKLFWPRGKMLGGCSSINAMIYNKGAPTDFDEWANMGNTGWAYKDISRYSKKSEAFFEPTALGSGDLMDHGYTGPWQIGYSFLSPLTQIFIDACAAIGIRKINDFNTSKGMLGVSRFQTFIDKKGQRSSTAVAFLTKDVTSRSNLKLATGQTVTRVIFDKSTPPRAVGVEMAASSISPIRYIATAKKEIILSAGALQSPQILKLSGIGSSDELQKYGIPVVKDLGAVGTNLADHLNTYICFESKLPSLQFLLDPIRALGSWIEWLRFGTGAMTSNIGEAACFIRLADRVDAPESLKRADMSSGPGSPDLEIIVTPLGYLNHGKQVPPTAKDWFSIGPVMLRPSSRGNISLTSPDPFEAPMICANYLATQYDRDFMVYGMRLAIQIAESGPFSAAFRGWQYPSNKLGTMSDAELLDIIRNNSETLYHPMCTNAMGTNEATSVVDAKLKVHGVRSLRVVDASIFPTPVACHPCATVVMVAEKAADLIKLEG